MSWAVRASWIFTGLAALAWVGFEDRGLAAVVGLSWAACLSALLTARFRRGRKGAPSGGWRWWLTAGGLAGASVGPLGSVLILVKTGLHAHPTADFSAADVGALLWSIPGWALSGALLGAGAALVETSRRP